MANSKVGLVSKVSAAPNIDSIDGFYGTKTFPKGVKVSFGKKATFKVEYAAGKLVNALNAGGDLAAQRYTGKSAPKINIGMEGTTSFSLETEEDRLTVMKKELQILGFPMEATLEKAEDYIAEELGLEPDAETPAPSTETDATPETPAPSDAQ